MTDATDAPFKDAADGPLVARLARALARADGHPARDAPRDPLLERGVRRGHPARPSAGGRSRASSATSRRLSSAKTCFSPGDGEEHLRNQFVLAREHGQRDRGVGQAPHERRLQARRRRPALRARGLDRRYGRVGAVAARSPQDHLLRRRRSRTWRAASASSNGSIYFVPAFSSSSARPYWRDDARGAILGLTSYANPGHIARAALESVAWQSKRGGRRRERGGRRAVQRAARRRRHDGERAPNAVPGGRARRAGHPASVTETTAWASLRGGPRVRFLVRPGRAARALAGGQALGALDGRERAGFGVRDVEVGGREDLRLGHLSPR